MTPSAASVTQVLVESRRPAAPVWGAGLSVALCVCVVGCPRAARVMPQSVGGASSRLLLDCGIVAISPQSRLLVPTRVSEEALWARWQLAEAGASGCRAGQYLHTLGRDVEEQLCLQTHGDQGPAPRVAGGVTSCCVQRVRGLLSWVVLAPALGDRGSEPLPCSAGMWPDCETVACGGQVSVGVRLRAFPPAGGAWRAEQSRVPAVCGAGFFRETQPC